MKETYKRDRYHNYLILEMEENFKENEYSIKMITYNQIPGLLRCEIRKVNGSISLYYDITSKQSVTHIFERHLMEYEDIRQFLMGIKRGMEGASGYLLDENSFLLDSEHLYMDVETREVFLCYVPGRKGDFQKEFRNFAEYILRKLDHGQEEAVILGYEIYRQSMEESGSIDQILQVIYHDVQGQKKEKKYEPIGSKEEKKGKKEVEEKRNREKKKRYGLLILSTILLFISNILIAFCLNWNLTQIGGSFAVWIALSSYTVSFFKNRTKKQQEEQIGYLNKKEEKKERKKKIKKFYGQDGKGDKVDFEAEDSEEETELLKFGETAILKNGNMKIIHRLVSQEREKRPDICIYDSNIIIGKMRQQSDIVLEDDHISRIHARIEQSGEDIYVIDLNSTNGTFVNGERLKTNERRRIYSGDEITFASFVYRYENNIRDGKTE